MGTRNLLAAVEDLHPRAVEIYNSRFSPATSHVSTVHWLDLSGLPAHVFTADVIRTTAEITRTARYIEDVPLIPARSIVSDYSEFSAFCVPWPTAQALSEHRVSGFRRGSVFTPLLCRDGWVGVRRSHWVKNPNVVWFVAEAISADVDVVGGQINWISAGLRGLAEELGIPASEVSAELFGVLGVDKELVFRIDCRTNLSFSDIVELHRGASHADEGEPLLVRLPLGR